MGDKFGSPLSVQKCLNYLKQSELVKSSRYLPKFVFSHTKSPNPSLLCFPGQFFLGSNTIKHFLYLKDCNFGRHPHDMTISYSLSLTPALDTHWCAFFLYFVPHHFIKNKYLQDQYEREEWLQHTFIRPSFNLFKVRVQPHAVLCSQTLFKSAELFLKY